MLMRILESRIRSGHARSQAAERREASASRPGAARDPLHCDAPQPRDGRRGASPPRCRRRVGSEGWEETLTPRGGGRGQDREAPEDRTRRPRDLRFTEYERKTTGVPAPSLTELKEPRSCLVSWHGAGGQCAFFGCPAGDAAIGRFLSDRTSVTLLFPQEGAR